MTWCAVCGTSGDKTRLFEAIADEGIIMACRDCIRRENLFSLKKEEELKENPEQSIAVSLPVKKEMSSSSRTMYERLSRLSGFKTERQDPEKMQIIKEQNDKLKELANKNYEKQTIQNPGATSELIDNFHWILMRARRSKHLTREQLAQAINEPEKAIIMAEQGVLPKNNNLLIRKLEQFLEINILKKPVYSESRGFGTQNNLQEELVVNPFIAKNLTISDLQEMKQKKESGFFKGFKKHKDEAPEEPGKIENENDELSGRDIDNILFGR